MNPTLMRILRAVAAVIVLVVLLSTVRGWWSQYETAPRPAQEPTVTVSPADPADEDQLKPIGTLVVLTDGLNLREKPAIDGELVRGLNEDETLDLLKKDGDWYLVRTDEDERGWISAKKGYTKLKKKD